MLPPTVRFDWIDGSYDDSNKLKPKNPQKHPYFYRLSEIHAIREGSDEPIQVKRTTACEQSTISYEQTYGLIRPNLLSLIVGFNRIDAVMIKTTNQIFKVNRSIHVL